MTIDIVSAANLTKQRKQIEEGYWFEEAFFGISSRDFNPCKIHGGERTTFYEKLARAIQLQAALSWDPRAPHTKLAKNLFLEVKKNLPGRIKERVLLCCTIGTPLDYFHGIDGCFILEDNTHGPVTFNLARTNCWFQRKKLRANGLITPADMARRQRVQYIGGIVAYRLLRAMRRKDGKTKRNRFW